MKICLRNYPLQRFYYLRQYWWPLPKPPPPKKKREKQDNWEQPRNQPAKESGLKRGPIEEKRIEKRPVPSTPFEIEEELKDAIQQERTVKSQQESWALLLEDIQRIKREMAKLLENPAEITNPILALRKEIDKQVRANKLDVENVKHAAVNLKTIPGDARVKDALYYYVPANEKSILDFFLECTPENIAEITKMNPTEALAVLQRRFIYPSSDSAIGEIPQVLKRVLDNAERKLEDGKKSASAAAAAWEKRHKILSDQLRKLQTNTVTDLVKTLPLLMVILGAFGAIAIILVRFFPPEVQEEWVASGQVIQLLTVVTLLLIILCVALAGIIHENTIGTLLGGIGGYVLSQGIGRAASRAAVRAGSQPPPPSQPPPDSGSSEKTPRQS